MNLHKLLKQLKKIEPHPHYVQKSRRMIIGERKKLLPVFSLKNIIFQTLQSGSVIALAGILIFLIATGFASKFFSPFQLAGLDPATLQAEAEAIDIQIQLAKIAYRENAEAELNLENATTTISSFSSKIITPSKYSEIKKQVEKFAEDLGLDINDASTSSVNIEAALDELSR